MPTKRGGPGVWIDTIDPTSSDDSAQPNPRNTGDRWINTTGPKTYTCTDDSPGAAVWTEEDTSGGGGGGTPATTVVDERLLNHAASAVGVSTNYAREDHTHGTPAMPSASDVGAVSTGRTLTTTAPLTIDGGASADLSANRTLAVAAATTSTAGVVVLETNSSDTSSSHVVTADDSRLSNARTPTGSAGGGLSGSYPNPSVVTGSGGVQAWDADLDALAANSTNGLWTHTGAGTGAARSIAVSGTGLSVSNGDGVSGNPTVTLDPSAAYDAASARSRTVVTTTGSYTNVTLPSDCKFVKITCVGPGSIGQAGTTGDNSANRSGGIGGGGGGWTSAVWRREQFPGTIFCRPGSANNTFNGTPVHSIVEAVNSGYTSSNLNNAGYVLIYANSAVGSGAGSAASVQNALGLKSALDFVALAGGGGNAGGASGQPSDLSLFGGTTTASTSGGAGGAGKSLSGGGTAAVGGGWAAMGPFSARGGGTNPGGAGTDGIYGPASGTWTSGSSNPYEFCWGYGGTGGGSHTSGTGGKGGAGALGCGGGGGGAGTTAGGAGGNGGDGFIVIETW